MTLCEQLAVDRLRVRVRLTVSVDRPRLARTNDTVSRTRTRNLQIWHGAGVCQGPSSNPTRRKVGVALG